jgi:hypothetical protein
MRPAWSPHESRPGPLQNDEGARHRQIFFRPTGTAGEKASWRFVEFFTANIRNTRAAYSRAVAAFCAWCEERGQDFLRVSPVAIAAYIEQLLADGLARPTVKQHLAAVRMLYDYMVTGGILPFNPAASLRGPKHVVRKGKAPTIAPTANSTPEIVRSSVMMFVMAEPKWDFVCFKYAGNSTSPSEAQVLWGRIGELWYWVPTQPHNPHQDESRLILATSQTNAVWTRRSQ